MKIVQEYTHTTERCF